MRALKKESSATAHPARETYSAPECEIGNHVGKGPDFLEFTVDKTPCPASMARLTPYLLVLSWNLRHEIGA